MVVRGGSLENQSAEKIQTRIGKSRTPGISGFSVQCSGTCTDVQSLTRNLPNSEVVVTKVGEIRKVGGDVINTPGSGNHATVTGVSGIQASPLFQNIIKNLNPRR